MAVFVQEQDFVVADVVADLKQGKDHIGAIVTFVGYVRDNEGKNLKALELEHYPAMTKAELQKLEDRANSKWALDGCAIVHRYGVIETGAQIMMVATASAHRKDAFEAAEFLMDYLKTDAPFWKKEHLQDGSSWVESRAVDEVARKRWSKC